MIVNTLSMTSRNSADELNSGIFSTGLFADRRGDLVDGGALGVADALATQAEKAFPVCIRDPVGEVEDEALVLRELLGRPLLLHELDRLANALEVVGLQLLDRVMTGVVDLRLCGDDLVEQLAVPVRLPSLRVRLRDREALAEGAPALRSDYDQGCAGRPLEHHLPLLGREVGLSRHLVALLSKAAGDTIGRSHEKPIAPGVAVSRVTLPRWGASTALLHLGEPG